MAKAKPTKMLAVLGRCRRGGRWQPAAKSSVLAVLGDCHLDMRKAIVDQEQPVKFQVTVFLGAVTFIVPPGVEIRPSGMSILAASRVAVPTAEEASFPLIEVEWTCILGRIRIISADNLAGAAIDPTAATVALPGAVGAQAGPIGVVGAPVAVPGAVGMPAGAAGAAPVAMAAPGAAAPATATAPAAAAAPGFGFENLESGPSPYAAAPAIPTLSEAMAAAQDTGAAAPPAVEPVPAFIDFAAGAADESDGSSGTSDEDSEEEPGLLDDGPGLLDDPQGSDDGGEDQAGGDDEGTASTAADSTTPRTGSGPASQEVGFADVLAAAG
jgi:hypothetical protein